MYRTLKSPLSAQVEVTWLCDNRCLHCLHCYNFWASRQIGVPLPTLSTEQMQKVIGELANNKVFEVTFTGGEPLLFPKVLLEGIRIATRAGMNIGLNSNLTRLTASLAEELRSLGLKSILTSLAGPTPSIHDAVVGRDGAFTETCRGIKLAREAGIRIAVNMVTTTVNQKHVYATGCLAASLGASCFGATRTTAPGNCPEFNSRFRIPREKVIEHLDILDRIRREFDIQVDVFEHYPHCLLGDLEKYSKMSKRRCVAGVTTVAIGADGSVRPCTHNSQSYGSIFGDGLGEAWLRMGEWRDGSLIPGICRQCEHLASCGGGCRMDAKAEGDIKAMDSYATDPKDVKPSPRKRALSPLPSRLRIANGLKTRSEFFGGVVKSLQGKPVLLDADGIALVMRLCQEDSFSLDRVAQICGVSLAEAEKFLAQLLAKEAVVPA